MVRPSVAAEVEQLLLQLPLLSGKRAHAAEYAQWLVLDSLLGRFNELPAATRTGKRGATRELIKLAKLSAQLGRHIKTMHSDTLELLASQRCEPPPLVLIDYLRTIGRAAVKALNAEADYSILEPARRGRPEKSQASAVAAQARDIYRDLTGLPATWTVSNDKASGPYLTFLKDLFAILDIKASPEAHARKVMGKKAQAKSN